MSSSTKTTQPRDPAKSSHFRRKMAQHKRDQPKQAGGASTTSESYSSSTRELKNEQDIRPWQQQAQHRPEESQTGSPKLRRWQAQASPAKTMSLTKWSSKISAGSVTTRNLALWYENFVTGALSNGAPKISSVAGPGKTRNLAL